MPFVRIGSRFFNPRYVTAVEGPGPDTDVPKGAARLHVEEGLIFDLDGENAARALAFAESYQVPVPKGTASKGSDDEPAPPKGGGPSVHATPVDPKTGKPRARRRG